MVIVRPSVCLSVIDCTPKYGWAPATARASYSRYSTATRCCLCAVASRAEAARGAVGCSRARTVAVQNELQEPPYGASPIALSMTSMMSSALRVSRSSFAASSAFVRKRLQSVRRLRETTVKLRRSLFMT